jgi:hypothetical protein
MKVINLWAGPGAGKSTTASGLFYLMKTADMQVELVTEYAKDMTWEGRHEVLQDQLYITAKQNRKLARLRNHNIDWVVTDSPLLLGTQYMTPDYLGGKFESMLFELWNSYDNLNFFIQRKKKYNPTGRNQTELEAREIDKKLLDFLSENDLEYTNVVGSKAAPNIIFDILFGEGAEFDYRK